MFNQITRKFIDNQCYLSNQFDLLLPSKYRIDENNEFINKLMENYLQLEIKFYGIGGDKASLISPFITKYFSFLFPAYLLWRLWIFTYHFLVGVQPLKALIW